MAKKDKTIPVSIEEKTVNGKEIEEVLVNKQAIGEIEATEDGKKFTATMTAGQKFTVKSQEEALQAILAEYNLHG
ncbi:DUF2969 domain-containing protein [Furfurilactobacillus sp. WILCCON 0119]|uniref:DUF2969 domain-containing protein n=1 Tax=Furfurilactobacillus entadae TaxID=2922307 RepID=UPI0035EDAECD